MYKEQHIHSRKGIRGMRSWLISLKIPPPLHTRELLDGSLNASIMHSSLHLIFSCEASLRIWATVLQTIIA
eukprot:12234853-Ditylum_brightwellii.AAC.1